MDDSRDTGRRPLRIWSVGGTLVLVVLIFVIGVWVGGHPRQTGLDRLPGGLRDALVENQRTALATEVLAILQKDYYKPLDPKVIQDAQNASVGELVKRLGDPYTEYLDPTHYKAFLDDRAGKYVGIGVEWRPDGESALVARVFKDGPADRAGIRNADRITAVDGARVQRSDGYIAMARVKGAEGTKVTLHVARTGAPDRDYAVTRAEIRRPVVESRIETVGTRHVGYVRLDQFTEQSAGSFKDSVNRLVQAKVDGIVFDLREDGGGLVNEAVGVASVFLPRGTLIATTRGRRGPQAKLTSRGGQIDGRIPLVVLVDVNSASASEIVSGALRDAGRARLVGTHTFGKALIQSTRPLPNGGALKYTVASYLTPKGFDLGSRGLPPDVEVQDDPKTPVDEALRRALAEVSAR